MNLSKWINGILFKIKDNLIKLDCRIILERKFLWNKFNKGVNLIFLYAKIYVLYALLLLVVDILLIIYCIIIKNLFLFPVKLKNKME